MYRPVTRAAVLHQVVALHLEAFLDAVAEAGDGVGLPSRGAGVPGVLLCGVSRPAWRGFSARAARASTW